MNKKIPVLLVSTVIFFIIGCSSKSPLEVTQKGTMPPPHKLMVYLRASKSDTTDNGIVSFKEDFTNAMHACGGAVDFYISTIPDANLSLVDEYAIDKEKFLTTTKAYNPDAVLKIVMTFTNPAKMNGEYTVELTDYHKKQKVWGGIISNYWISELAPPIIDSLKSNGILQNCASWKR